MRTYNVFVLVAAGGDMMGVRACFLDRAHLRAKKG